MKRTGFLFEKIVDINNIVLARLNARQNKTNDKQVQMVDRDILGYCKRIQKMLIDKTYTTSKYHTFKIKDRGKERDICELPYFPDRIVQWAIMQVLEKVFMKHLISTTYAALRGEYRWSKKRKKFVSDRGTHAALTKLHKFMEDREGTQYCLKLDVKKFFPSIHKDILKRILRRLFKDDDVLWILDDIVDSGEQGIPIGNYTSQYFGNIYLSQFDHWLKEQKRVKYYLRYMDDMVILSNSKEYLHQLRKEIEAYLLENLGLKLKENWQVFPTYVRGIDFVGYRSFGDYTLLRRSTKARLKIATKKLLRKTNTGAPLSQSDQSTVGSYKGILEWGDCARLKNKTINKILGGQHGNGKRKSGSKAA